MGEQVYFKRNVRENSSRRILKTKDVWFAQNSQGKYSIEADSFYVWFCTA